MIGRYITSHSSEIQGMIWMLWASFWFAVMTSMIRYMSEEMGTFQMVFIRNMLCAVLLVPWFIQHRPSFKKPLNIWKLYMYRALSGLIGMWLLFYAISFVPLADVVSLTFTVPLFTTILAVIFLREKVGIHRIISLIIGFVGVLIIVRPGSEAFHFASVLILIATLTWSISNIYVKRITRHEDPYTILFFAMLIMAPLAFPTALLDWQAIDAHDMLWLIMLAFVTNQAQGALIHAYASTDMNVVLPLDFSRLIFITILAYIFFDEWIDLYTFVGSIVIFGSALYILHREKVRRNTR